MSQRIAAVIIVIVAIVLTIFAFTQQQGAANNEATAIARANSAGTAQSQAEADQQTAVFQMDTHATAQSQAEATRAAAEVSAQQAAATSVAAVDEAIHQSQLAETAQAGATQQAQEAATAQAGATQQAQEAATAQAGATQQAQVAATAHHDATEQAITATAAQREAIQLANTAEAFQAEVTAQANQLATQESQASAVAATAQNAQIQFNQLATRSTAEAVVMQQTLTALEAQAAIPAAPEETIQYLVERKVIPENVGELGARRGKITIDMTGQPHLIQRNNFPGVYRDFVVSADIHWGGGTRDDTCGFNFRVTDNGNFSWISINRLNNLRIDTLVNNKWESTESPILTPLIRSEVDRVNQMMVIGTGNLFTVYLNGAFVTTYRHDGPAEGQVELAAGTDTGGKGASCTFQNAWVWDLAPDASATPTTPELTNQFKTQDGKLSVSYPDGWKAAEAGSSTVLYSKGFKPLDQSDSRIQPGEMTVVISVLSTRTDNPPDIDLTIQTLTTIYAVNIGNYQVVANFTKPDSFSLDGRSIRRVIATSSMSDAQFWIYRDHGVTIGVVIGCAPGERASCEPLAEAIVQSIRYDLNGKKA